MPMTLRQQRDRISLYWLFFLFALLPLTAVFGHRGVAPWLLLASLPAFARGDFWQSAFGQLFDAPDLRRPFFAGFVAILIFCVWIFLSGFWSPRGEPSLMLYVLAPALVGGSVVWFAMNLTGVWAYLISYAFVMAVAGGAGVLAVEGLTGGFLRGLLPPHEPGPPGMRDAIALGRGVTALAPALFSAAALAAMLKGKRAGAGVLAIGFLAALTNDIAANATALIAGAAAGGLALLAPRAALACCGCVILALLFGAPLMAFLPVEAIFERFGGVAPSSWLHRVAVWQSVSAHIPQAMPFGAGADYARIWKETAPMIAVPGAAAPLSLMPTHPHNIFLQIWLELGAVGVMSIAAFVFFGMRALTRARPRNGVAVAACGALGAIAVSMFVEGSLWQVWRMAAMALAAMGAALVYSLYRLRSEQRS